MFYAHDSSINSYQLVNIAVAYTCRLRFFPIILMIIVMSHKDTFLGWKNSFDELGGRRLQALSGKHGS